MENSKQRPKSKLIFTLISVAGICLIVFTFLAPSSKNNDQNTLWHNPNTPWYEKYFCKGNVRAFFCNEQKLHHPFKEVMDSYNISEDSNFAKERLIPKTQDKSRVVQYSEEIDY